MLKEKAITELRAGTEITMIAKIVNTSRTTIYNWCRDAEFKKELELRRKQIVDSGNAYVMAHTMSYLEVIHKLAMSTSDKRTALMAAQYLVDRSLGKVSTRLDITTEAYKNVHINIGPFVNPIPEDPHNAWMFPKRSRTEAEGSVKHPQRQSVFCFPVGECK